MDSNMFLPFELLEEIFSYLSEAELIKCSRVSLRWREAANSGKLWRTICENLSWKDQSALCDIRSSFLDQTKQFCLPHLSNRLSPVSSWKQCYLEQKYVSLNWRRGQYATHSLGENIKVSSCLSLTWTDTAEPRFPFFPIVERVGSNYEFIIMRVDGVPTKVCRLENNEVNRVSVICIVGNTVAYVIENVLKIASYQNGGFSVIHEYDLKPSANELSKSTLNALHSYLFSTNPNYFICMNLDYVIAGNKHFYFFVWDRKTGNKLGFVKTPVAFSIMSSFCMNGDCLYFGVAEHIYQRFEVYEYNIVGKTMTLIDTAQYPIYQIFSYKFYLIVICIETTDNTEVFIYNLITREREENFFLGNVGWLPVVVLLENNLLFCFQPRSIKVMCVPSCEVKIEFKIDNYVVSSYLIRQNLLCLTTAKEIEAWDWENAVLLYKLSVEFEAVNFYHDTYRLIVMPLYDSAKRAKIISFW